MSYEVPLLKVVIIGGGIAGLSAAHALSAIAGAEITLVEAEPNLFAHSSGRNAAIYRPLEEERVITALALRSALLLDELCGERDAWLRRCGLLLTASAAPTLRPFIAMAEAMGVRYEGLSKASLVERAPVLRGGKPATALWLPDAGVLDLHHICQTLERSARSNGVRFALGRRIERIVLHAGHVTTVQCDDGNLAADCIVVAGGAWAAELAATCGAVLPLQSLRRHLMLLQHAASNDRDAPVVWDVELGAYFRNESGAVLACPGDATPAPAGIPSPDPAALALLSQKLKHLSPALATAGVMRSWACLRTFAPDRVSAVGSDPHIEGLFWLAGLGGHGLSCGVACAEVLRAAVLQRSHPLSDALAPSRLVAAL